MYIYIYIYIIYILQDNEQIMIHRYYGHGYIFNIHHVSYVALSFDPPLDMFFPSGECSISRA
jgi:hypothetical protein